MTGSLSMRTAQKCTIIVRTLAVVACVLASLTAAFAQGAAPQHPRMLFGAEEVPNLQKKITQEPWLSMYNKLIADVVKSETAEVGIPYSDSMIAEQCAFLYVLSGDDKWAKKARALVEKRINDNAFWANPKAKGLSLFWHGSRISLAYDWCYGAPSWDAAFSTKISQELKKHGDVILKSGGSGQNNSRASNWQGARFAAAGLCLLATDETVLPADLDQCHTSTVRYLTENLNNSKDSRGWNIEGLGYTFYPMGNFIGPYGIAIARKDPAKDLRKMSIVGWTYWTTLAVDIKAMGTIIRPDFGDDNAGTDSEGAASQAFYYCPDALKPGLVYEYDRLWGAKGNKNYDSPRGGTIYSILYHPGAALAEKDPMSIPEWRAGFIDKGGNGFFTYRNSYQCNDNDVVAQIYTKLRGDKGHAGPDALSFRIQGLDTAWAVGGGRYGPKINTQDAYIYSMDTLYPVKPEEKLTTNSNTGKIVGTPISKEDGSGNVVLSIAANNVGVKNQKRWFISDFSAATSTNGTFVIADTSDDGKFWQLCTLEENTITSAGNTFTITAKNGNTMKGTVLYPAAGVTFTTGTRIRGTDFITGKNGYVHFQSPDGKYLVVLTLEKKGQEHPAITSTGNWGAEPKTTVTVGKFNVDINGDVISYPAAK